MYQEQQYYVYMMMSYLGGALYIGVTNDLHRRVTEHKDEVNDGFTKKYNCKKLVYFEVTSNISSAIEREKQLKRWSRKKKESLIKQDNLNLEDLYERLL